MKQQVRIIGGQFRGKKIDFPASMGLRPTPDRVRETLFNWLMHDIRGSRCLDAFAGSGALGLEACSRGANTVIMVEKSKTVYNHLKKISSSFKHPGLEIIHDDAIEFIQNRLPDPFNIIFVDPPFSQLIHMHVIKLIMSHNLLLPDGLLYIESPAQLNLDEQIINTTPKLRLIKKKQAGNVSYALYVKC